MFLDPKNIHSSLMTTAYNNDMAAELLADYLKGLPVANPLSQHLIEGVVEALKETSLHMEEIAALVATGKLAISSSR